MRSMCNGRRFSPFWTPIWRTEVHNLQVPVLRHIPANVGLLAVPMHAVLFLASRTRMERQAVLRWRYLPHRLFRGNR
jgi:hypothetical protein